MTLLNGEAGPRGRRPTLTVVCLSQLLDADSVGEPSAEFTIHKLS